MRSLHQMHILSHIHTSIHPRIHAAIHLSIHPSIHPSILPSRTHTHTRACTGVIMLFKNERRSFCEATRPRLPPRHRPRKGRSEKGDLTVRRSLEDTVGPIARSANVRPVALTLTLGHTCGLLDMIIAYAHAVIHKPSTSRYRETGAASVIKSYSSRMLSWWLTLSASPRPGKGVTV